MHAGSTDGDSKVVLVNAIYFQGKWELPFSPSLTKNRPFYLADGFSALVPTMQIDEETFRIASLKHLDSRILEIPYEVC